MKSLLLRASALLALAILPRTASALVIDNFDNGGFSLNVNAANPIAQSVTTGAGILGGEREATVVYYGAGSTALDDVNLRVDFLNQNNFSHSQDAGVAGLTALVYDGNEGNAATVNHTGLGGVDLTAEGSSAFLFSVLFADQSASNVLSLRVYTDASNYSDFVYSFAAPINSLTNLTFLYSSFLPGVGSIGGADFTNVGAIVLIIDGTTQQALDIRLDAIETDTVVPEPATLGLLGLGLTGIGMIRRRRATRA